MKYKKWVTLADASTKQKRMVKLRLKTTNLFSTPTTTDKLHNLTIEIPHLAKELTTTMFMETILITNTSCSTPKTNI